MIKYDPTRSPVFTERFEYLKATEYSPRAELREIQLQKFRHLVRHVQQYVPFYRSYMQQHAMSWQDINSLDMVKRFPLIDKTVIRENYNAFVSENASMNLLHARTTGGSTGNPLTVYSDDDFLARDKANTQYYMHVFGLDIFNYRSIRLYGDQVDDDHIDSKQYGYLATPDKLVLSCYHVTAETAVAYVQQINQHVPDYIHTRPSAIFPLARFINEQKLMVNPTLKFIFSDGEYITEGQRAAIEQAFSARLINVYGHTEGCTFGFPCCETNALHFPPQVSLMELLDESSNQVSVDGEKGQLVVTGFNNFVFPLIRYCTGDIGIWRATPCKCGRSYDMLHSIEGRIQDYVISKQGEKVPLAPAIFNYNDMNWQGIREFRVIQDIPGQLTFCVEKECWHEVNNEVLADYLKRNLESILGGQFDLSIQFVDSIERTKIGKHRYLQQNLEIS